MYTVNLEDVTPAIHSMLALNLAWKKRERLGCEVNTAPLCILIQNLLLYHQKI